MLKIKDNVDLKELKKFGFTVYENRATYHNLYYDEYIFVDNKKRIEVEADMYFDELDIGGNSTCKIFSRALLNTLYDLIQAGLVEKAGDIDE